MAQTNFTDDENQKTYIELRCSAEFIRSVDGELIFTISSLNIFLSITAFLGNTLILVALHRETSIHPPSKLLYRNLAITDLCVGIILEPLAVAYFMSVVNTKWNICYYTSLARRLVAYTLCSVSLLTSTAISVDRLLALLLGLRYRQVVTLRRTCITTIGFWIFSTVGSSTLFSNSLIIVSWLQYIGTAVCLVTTIFAYTKILFSLRHNQIHVENHVAPGQASQAGNSTEHSSIQKGSVQCIVGTGDIGYLSSAARCSRGFDTSTRDDFIDILRQRIYFYFNLFKLVVKPVAVLLEDQRSTASCKGNIKATILSIELVYYAFKLKIHQCQKHSKSDLKTNHTHVMYTYSLLHQRRIFGGNSSIHILPPPPPPPANSSLFIHPREKSS